MPPGDDAELAEIERFLAEHGVVRGPVAFAAPTVTDLSRAEEGRRLKRLRLKETLSGRDYMQMLITRHCGIFRRR
jgi:hypothetical protein